MKEYIMYNLNLEGNVLNLKDLYFFVFHIVDFILYFMRNIFGIKTNQVLNIYIVSQLILYM